MKNLRVVISILLMVCFVITACGSAVAAEAERKEQIDKAFDYVVENYLPKFGDEYTADFWSLLMGACAGTEEVTELIPLMPIYDAADFDAATKLTDYAQAAMVVSMSGEEMHNLGEIDLIAPLKDAVDKNLDNLSVYEIAYITMAFTVTETEYDSDALFAALEEYAAKDGGYSWEKGAATGDIDVTGIVALAISDDENANDALAERISNFLKACVDENGNYVSPGGFTWEGTFFPNTANCNTQAMAIITLLAIGDDISDDVYAALAAYQTEEGGFKYNSYEAPDYISTNQAIIALGFANMFESFRSEDPTTSDDTSSQVSSNASASSTSDVASTESTQSTESTANTSNASTAPTSVKPAAQTNNNNATAKTATTTPKTGDDGVTIIIIGAVVAVAAVLACILVPIIKKSKKKDDDYDDDGEE